MNTTNLFAALDVALGDENSIQGDYTGAIRASSLPFCPREYVMHRAGNLAPTKDSTFVGDCYLEMGTALHTVAQRYMGLAGLMYGNWRCPTCQRLFEDTRGPVRCCEQLAVYEEYALVHESGITAHPDGVCLELPDGTPFRAIWEFKGCHPRKMSAMKGPIWQHALFQANFYLNLVNDQKHLGLEHIVIIYVDRGLPNNRRYWLVKPNRAVYDNTIASIKDAKEKLRLRVLPERMCATQKDGQDLRCAYASVCFNENQKVLDFIAKT